MNIWYGLPAQGITVDDFADDAYDHAGLGFVGGTSLHVRTERHPIEGAAMATYGKAPSWGAAWKKFVHENAAKRSDTYLQTSTFPYETCYLDLDPDGERSARRSGLPHHHRRREAERDARSRYAQQKMEQWFREAGAVAVQASELACPLLPRTLTAAPAWATIPEPTLSTAGAFRTRRPTWASWALR